MKSLMMVLAVIFCVTATSASAEQSRGASKVTVTDRTSISKVQANCIRQCLDQQSPADCQRARQGARDSWRRLLARLSSYESRIAVLEGRVGGLADRDAELGQELEELRGQVAQLNVRMDAVAQLIGDIEAVQHRLGSLEEGQDRQDTELEDLRSRVTTLEERIEHTRRRDGVVQLGITGGFVGIFALDGSSFYGAPVGLRISLRVNRLIGVFVEPMITLAVHQYWIGTTIRGGLQFEFLNGQFMLETAVSGMWVGLDSQLDAIAAYITGDVGVTWRPRIDWVEFSLAFNAGIELDQCDPAAAFGGTASVRFNIPRF
ncbi:MAG: hypothetical protein V1738_00775 [Patescibacteria group bacterium]